LKRLFAGRLWRHPDFLLLWSGQTISQAGSQVSQLAIPTVAILVLHASAFEVGLLTSLEFLAFLVLGLVAGVYADRLRRRPIMIVTDLGRALVLASIPVAYFAGSLTMYQLYVVALVTGVCTVFFDIAYQSYLPALIDRTDLVEGNSKLEVSNSGAQIVGPAIAGFLIQVLKAPAAVAVDAASFLVSVVSVALIRKPEPAPEPATETGQIGFRAEMAEGIAVVFKNPYLRRIAGCNATSNFGTNMGFAVYLIFCYRELGLSPGTVGLVFAVISVGWLAGAFLATPMARRFGVGPTLLISITVSGLAAFLTPLAHFGFAVPVLIISGLLGTVGVPIYNINQVSMRQAITPDRVQGRMNATMRTIVWGTIPVGAFLGGVLGTLIGIIPTLLVGAALGTLSGLWIAFGPVIKLREQPAPVGGGLA
jgi:MFS family permease